MFFVSVLLVYVLLACVVYLIWFGWWFDCLLSDYLLFMLFNSIASVPYSLYKRFCLFGYLVGLCWLWVVCLSVLGFVYLLLFNLIDLFWLMFVGGTVLTFVLGFDFDCENWFWVCGCFFLVWNLLFWSASFCCFEMWVYEAWCLGLV